MCLSVLNWINDLFVSVFLEVIAKKKKKGPILMNSGQVVVCLFLFFKPNFGERRAE